MDVFNEEPPKKNNVLFNLNNIILTPHNSALTIECRKRMAIESCQNVVYYLKKDKSLNIKNIINLKKINY